MTIKASFTHLLKNLFLVSGLLFIGLSLAGCAGMVNSRGTCDRTII